MREFSISGVRAVNWFSGKARKAANRCLIVWCGCCGPTNKSRNKWSRTSTRRSERHSLRRLGERAFFRTIAEVALMRPSRFCSANFLFSFLSRRALIPRSVRWSSSASLMLNRTRILRVSIPRYPHRCPQIPHPLLSEKPGFVIPLLSEKPGFSHQWLGHS